MLQRSDAEYSKFLAEETQDSELDKMVDQLIDEGLAAGKTDKEILAELSGKTGLVTGGNTMTLEQTQKHQESISKNIADSLSTHEKQKVIDSFRTTAFEGQDEFEEFTERHSKM